MTDPETPVVACHNLDVALDGFPILHDITTHVGAGQTVALLGGNGSGKTTLLRTLLGLTPISGGVASLFGTPVGSFHEWARVGYVPQRAQFQVATANVTEVVASGRLAHQRWFHPLRAADKQAIADALDVVNMTGLATHRVAHLSGGQRQRTLIARALATRPDLMVLDEPLAGLDMDTQAGLADVLARLHARGTTILIVLHELGPLESLLDRCVVLQTGRVIYDGALQSAPGAPPDEHHHDEDALLVPGVVPQPTIIPGGAR